MWEGNRDKVGKIIVNIKLFNKIFIIISVFKVF